MEGLEVLGYTGEGYRTTFIYEGWRVAFLNHAEMFTEEGVSYLERHTKTDEVFILLSGSAVLLMGKNAERIEMEQGKLYVVKKNAWHNIIVSKGTKVLIVENADTGKMNSEYLPYSFQSACP